jgi:hypothetical protein
MTDYDYDDRPRRRRSTRTREPEYVEDTETYVSRANTNRDVVLRRRDDDDDVVSHRRSSYRDDYGPPRRARSHVATRDRDSFYEDDRYTEYDRRSGRRSSRYGDDDSYYHSDDYDRPRERRKSKIGDALQDIGLGGVVAAVTGKGRSRSRRRRDSDPYRRDSYDDGYSVRSRSRDNRKKLQQAATSAALAGLGAAFQARNAPGGWKGEKGRAVATAALTAAAVDAFLDRDPEHKSKRHIMESAIGGLVTSQLATGRDKSRGRDTSRSPSEGPSRSRGRSRSVIDTIRSRSKSILRGRSSSRPAGGTTGGSTLKDVAALGGVAAGVKAIYDRVRSKSRGRLGGGRDRSPSSDDSYVPSRRQRYNRRSRGDTDREHDGGLQLSRGLQAESGPVSTRGETRDREHSVAGSKSSISTTDLEKRRRKTRGKELMVAGLATVATIHAVHGVYSSVAASKKRHKLVLKGEMTPEDARKRKTKNIMQDAAAVGIAALGIKSAYSEWKEMREMRKEKHEIEARHRRHLKRHEREARRPPDDQGYPAGPYDPAPSYADANPYHAYDNIPRPPVGGPPR